MVRSRDKRDGKPGPTASGKAIVAGAIKRKGNVIARVVNNVKRATLEAFVNEAVSEKVSLLCTDQWVGYSHLGDKFPHATVDHQAPIRCRRGPYPNSSRIIAASRREIRI
jgi:IS1 family transposase